MYLLLTVVLTQQTTFGDARQRLVALSAVERPDTASHEKSPAAGAGASDTNEKGSEPTLTPPESGLPEKSEAAVKSISS